MGGAVAPVFRRFARESRAGRGQILIDRPRQRTVIDDDVVGADGRERIGLPAAAWANAGRSGAYADVLQDYVVRQQVDAGADQRDAGGGRRLSGDRQERLGDLQLALLRSITPPTSNTTMRGPSLRVPPLANLGRRRRASSRGGCVHRDRQGFARPNPVHRGMRRLRADAASAGATTAELINVAPAIAHNAM